MFQIYSVREEMASRKNETNVCPKRMFYTTMNGGYISTKNVLFDNWENVSRKNATNAKNGFRQQRATVRARFYKRVSIMDQRLSLALTGGL